ncbi:proteasome accessory factor B [Microbacteriaceae bacterium MWH-Ta3]|nr:proteasome accessory factor B [Microbacteriaceae bacterium MWH-Ta3]
MSASSSDQSIRLDREVKAEERLLCLLMALLSTHQGLSKKDIYENVRGYRERFLNEGSSESLDRLFERDKKDLKSQGVTISDNGAENPADTRYVIGADDYNMAEFTPTEINLLNSASAIWQRSTLSDTARTVSRRVAALGVDAADEFFGFAPRVTTHDRAFAPLSRALESGNAVTFDYLKAGAHAAESRAISPLALVQYHGHWMVNGWDHARNAERNFLLARIVSDVTKVRGSAQRTPEANHESTVIAHLDELWDSLTATVTVAPGSEADIVLRNRQDTTASETGMVIHYFDEAVLADELCAFGPDVRVEEPASLRSAVIDRLKRLEADHG